MGRSFLLGNSGYLGRDRRDESGSTGGTGNVSVRKHFLERRGGNLTPGCSPNEPGQTSTTGILYQEVWDDFEPGNWITTIDNPMRWSIVSGVGVGGSSAGVCFNTGTTDWDYEFENFIDIHLWVNLWVPPEVNNISLDFDWQCDGESTFDFGYVWITGETAPITSIEYNDAIYKNNRLGGDNAQTFTNDSFRRYNSSYNATAASAWVSEPQMRLTADTTQSGPGDTDDIGVGTFIAGEYNKFIFSFTCDDSVENNPPMGVDNIVWRYTASTAICNDPDSPNPF